MKIKVHLYTILLIAFLTALCWLFILLPNYIIAWGAVLTIGALCYYGVYVIIDEEINRED